MSQNRIVGHMPPCRSAVSWPWRPPPAPAQSAKIRQTPMRGPGWGWGVRGGPLHPPATSGRYWTCHPPNPRAGVTGFLRLVCGPGNQVHAPALASPPARIILLVVTPHVSVCVHGRGGAWLPAGLGPRANLRSANHASHVGGRLCGSPARPVFMCPMILHGTWGCAAGRTGPPKGAVVIGRGVNPPKLHGAAPPLPLLGGGPCSSSPHCCCHHAPARGAAAALSRGRGDVYSTWTE